jgi:crossover junction endodeoxyribonuclease RusA
MTLNIVLPWPVAQLSPNGRWHYMQRYRAAQVAKKKAYYATLEAAGEWRPVPGMVLRMTLTAVPGKGTRVWDDDNFIAAHKAACDGIAEALGIDDRHFRLAGVVRGKRELSSRVIVTLEAG